MKTLARRGDIPRSSRREHTRARIILYGTPEGRFIVSWARLCARVSRQFADSTFRIPSIKISRARRFEYRILRGGGSGLGVENIVMAFHAVCGELFHDCFGF